MAAPRPYWPGISEWPGALARYVKDSAAVDFGPGRLIPWVPVAFGLGIAIYFTAEHEPSAIASALLVIAGLAVTYTARMRPVAFPLAVLVTAIAAGFAAVTIKAVLIAHPVLERPVFGAAITGFVESREERERSDRFTVRIHSLEGMKQKELPERVRVSVKRGHAPAVGAFVSFKARLTPPLAPLRPGGYDFARDQYFQRLGASGFVTGAIKLERPPAPPTWRLRYATMIDGVRDGIDKRIRAAVPGDAGAIASALITGKRDAISSSVNEAMYVSSLAHILSISGYHMAIVAGVVFFTIRALLALIPGMAVRRPIKKWGAVGALTAAAAYLALSGAEVATQRAFIMTAIVLIGVMADRAALTLRTLSVAAMAVLLIAPEAVVHPSFQMSFAATLALVAAYERGLPWAIASRDTTLRARVALWGGYQLLALIFASLIAGLATTPYAAYHFHRIAPYGVLANLLAMPIVSLWVMPVGLLALVAMPFGLDAPLWRLMGTGIGWMTDVAQWVTSLPGAVGRVSAFGVGALLLATGGLLVMCLLRSRLRWAGVVPVVVAGLMAMHAPKPDFLVSASGDVVGVRTGEGRLAIVRFGGDAFAIRDWLSADADARSHTDKTLRDGFGCDPQGCVARTKDGAIVAVSRSAQTLAEDCTRAALVVTQREAPPGCAATVLDRKALQTSGASEGFREDGRWRLETAYPPGYARPWAKRAPAETPPATARPASRDATPREEDLEAGD
ncbi:MAG TPA: ComEC/Rec2 family competence protein [Xanthobacteraceae bacterium]|nr:ComEC/Rec2 family competence protein [Xanthobacteraceae bacterium]